MNEESFWESSISRWIRNCVSGPNAVLDENEWRSHQRKHLDSCIRFIELCDGHVLNLIFAFAEPESVNRPLLQKTQSLDFKPDLPHKIRAFHHLLRSLCSFFRKHCLHIISLPDVLRIVEEPLPEKSGNDMQKLFGLLLGALIYSDSDQRWELLSQLHNGEDESELVAELTKITGKTDFLISLKSDNNGILDNPETVRRLLETLVDERNSYALRLLKMAEELESDEASCTTISSSGVDFHENGTNSSSSSKKLDQIQQLKEKNESLERTLILKLNEIKIANDAAQEYENELNDLRHEFAEQSKQLKEANVKNVELSAELRIKKDDIDQLNFDCQKLKHAEDARKILLKEKEKWSIIKDENDDLKKRLKSLEQSIPSLRAESSACNEFRAKNESLNIEIVQLRNSLNQYKMECAEATTRSQKLEEENEQLRHELKQASISFADRSQISDAEFSANLSLEEQLNRSTITDLEHKLHDMQLELARAAQPEELKRVQNEYVELQRRFNELAKEKESIDEKLKDRNVELTESIEKLRQAERSRVELKSKLVELNVIKAQLQQQEIIQREKEFLSNKLKNCEETICIQKEQISKEVAKNQQLEQQIHQQKHQLVKENTEFHDQLQKLRLEHDGCARLRKSLESECASLREQIEALEEELSHIKLNFTNSDLIRKRLTSAEQSLLEKQSVLNELESDNQALNQQIELANSKIQRLREDLLNEKTRLADLLSRLRSICTTCRLKSSDADQRLSDEELMKDDNLMINTIDSLLLSVFTAARTEADSLKAERQVQLEEINVLRRNIEDLKETHSQFDTANGDVTQDTLRNKLGVLQERLNASLARENEITAEVQAAKRTVEDLQRQLQQSMKTNAELTRLRISQRELEQEMHSVKQSLSDTTEKLHLSNKERHDLNNKLIRQQQTHQAQQTEIERLTNLNNSLAHDFDRSRFDNNELKRKIDQLNDANLTSTNRHLEYNNIEESMRQARDALKSERDRLAISEQSLTRITRELNETRRDYAALLRQKDTTSEELAQLSETNAAQKSVITSLNLTIQQLNNALSDKENELASFRKEIGTLREYNSDENKLLVRQIEMLMRQNQDLHKRSDTFYSEQKDLQEKLLTVRRHKEKLEEKLVDSMRKSEKTTLVKRAARALHLRSPSRKSNTRVQEKASGSEDSSIYSADEGFLPSPPQPIVNVPRNDNILISKPPNGCRLTPACSSSDRGSGSSPDYDQIQFGVHHSKKNSIDSQSSTYASIMGPAAQFRARNTRIGGSLRCSPSVRPNAGNWRIPTSIDEDMLSLNGSERSIDVRTPIRGSIRQHRLPPPYIPKQQNNRALPPSYSVVSRLTPPVKLQDFAPIDTSTPKSDNSSTTFNTSKLVPKEGEQRAIQLDINERQAKGHSFYDNHNGNQENLNETSTKPTNNNDLWVGYGCV